MVQIRKAVIPVAGYATRFLPQTKAMAKQMLPLVDKPVIQVIVEELVNAGIKDIIMVTGSHEHAIADHFDKPSQDLVTHLKTAGKRDLLRQIQFISEMANFVYIRQKGPYGNGTPLLNVENLIGDEPFLYYWGDDFIVSNPPRTQQMITAYEKLGGSILGSIKATAKNGVYDRCGFAGGKKIAPGVIQADRIVEKPGKAKAPSNLGNVCFLLTPDIFPYVKKAANRLTPDKELYYNDALRLMLKDHLPVFAVEIKNAHYYDTGNKLEYLKTVVEFGLRHPDFNGQFRRYLKTLKLD